MCQEAPLDIRAKLWIAALSVAVIATMCRVGSEITYRSQGETRKAVATCIGKLGLDGVEDPDWEQTHQILICANTDINDAIENGNLFAAVPNATEFTLKTVLEERAEKRLETVETNESGNK